MSSAEFFFCECPSGIISCRFCSHAAFLRQRPTLPVEPGLSSCGHRGFASRRKRAYYDPNLIFHWIPEDDNSFPALARARVHVSANSK